MKRLLLLLPMHLLSMACLWGNTTDSLLNVLRASLVNRHLYEQRAAQELPMNEPFAAIMQWIDDGFIYEAEEALAAHSPQQLSPDEKADFYRCRMNLSRYLQQSHRNDSLAYRHAANLARYQDSLLLLLPPESRERPYHEALVAMRRQEYRTAYPLLEQVAAATADNHPLLVARALEKMAEIDAHFGEREKADDHLIRKAIVCVKNRVGDYSGLIEVARMKMRQDETEEARLYLTHAQEYARSIASPLLAVELNQALTELSEADSRELAAEKHRLYFFFTLLSVMAAVLLFSIRKINRQMHLIAEGKQQVETLYADVEKQKDALEQMNAELTQLAQELKQANAQLSEASLLKEEYIGHFLKQCSEYLHKLQDYKKMVNRKIQAGQIDELMKQNASNRMVQEEARLLYQKFDIAFLKLFPRFVEQFNALLVPDERYELHKDELLNTELRLFALIRLGIKDSSQIADFLGYSVTTIYTYRTRIKNKSLGNREDFEADVMKIGR